MRRHSEENIRQNYRTSDGMFAVTSDQKIKNWNAAAEKILGYRQEQVISKKCYDLLVCQRKYRPCEVQAQLCSSNEHCQGPDYKGFRSGVQDCRW